MIKIFRDNVSIEQPIKIQNIFLFEAGFNYNALLMHRSVAMMC